MAAIPQPPELPPITWLGFAAVEMDWKWSKNKMWTPRRYGSKPLKLSPEAESRRDYLQLVLRADLSRRGARFLPKPEPVWCRIHVKIPDFHGDAVNVMDLVVDGAWRAVGIDDRYFALAGLTWEVDRACPQILVWVGQATG